MPHVDGLAVQANVPLAPLTTLRVGGQARWFARATDAEAVAAAHSWCAERSCSMFVLGGGSNLVIDDAGVDGLVLQIALTGTSIARDGGDLLVRAPAGDTWDRVVAATVEQEGAGLECLSGIPGSVGGTPIQNVGAYGQDVGHVIEHVTVFDRARGVTESIPARDCGFAYRMSRFKAADAGRFVVLDVRFRLRSGPPTVVYPDVREYLERERITAPALLDVRQAVLAIRRRKGMVLDDADGDTRSVGSFFMNPVVTEAHRERIAAQAGVPAPGFGMSGGMVKIPAAWLIERAGFQKGHRDGAAGISTKHPLALVNRGGATAQDMIRLAVRVKRQVADRFEVALKPEPIFVGFAADPGVQYLQSAES
jgi:UDP-N-acetylmuramate dehydrogenase